MAVKSSAFEGWESDKIHKHEIPNTVVFVNGGVFVSLPTVCFIFFRAFLGPTVGGFLVDKIGFPWASTVIGGVLGAGVRTNNTWQRNPVLRLDDFLY